MDDDFGKAKAAGAGRGSGPVTRSQKNEAKDVPAIDGGPVELLPDLRGGGRHGKARRQPKNAVPKAAPEEEEKAREDEAEKERKAALAARESAIALEAAREVAIAREAAIAHEAAIARKVAKMLELRGGELRESPPKQASPGGGSAGSPQGSESDTWKDRVEIRLGRIEQKLDELGRIEQKLDELLKVDRYYFIFEDPARQERAVLDFFKKGFRVSMEPGAKDCYLFHGGPRKEEVLKIFEDNGGLPSTGV